MTTTTLNRFSLAALLTSIVVPTQITLRAVTNPKVKAACPFRDTLEKESRIVGVIGANYQATVQVRQVACAGVEPDFQAEKPTWGQRINGSALIEHKGKHYVEVFVEESIFPSYRYAGGELKASQVTPYLYSKGSATQDAAGLEKRDQVKVARYSLESLREVTINGITYELR